MMSPSLQPITLALGVRPLRSVVLVPELEGVDWRSVFRHALRTQTATWGGLGNLVLPTPRGEAPGDDELFWTLLDVFDPDLVLGLAVTAGDLASVEDADAAASNGGDVDELADRPLRSGAPDGELRRLLDARLSPLTITGVATAALDAADPPAWPQTAAERLRPLPAEIDRVAWPAGGDLALLDAATNGEPSPRLERALEQLGVRVNAAVPGADGGWEDALRPRLRAPWFALSALGLAKAFPPGWTAAGLVLCVGDDPWDLAFAGALDRLGVEARWVPKAAVEDPVACRAYESLARDLAGYAGLATIDVCSTSSEAGVGALIAALGAIADDLEWRPRQPLDLVPREPARYHERDNAGEWRTLLLVDGETPRLATPAPLEIQAASPDDLHWMTEVEVDGWSAVRHRALGDRLLRSSTLAPGGGRVSCRGLSFLCPGAAPGGASAAVEPIGPRLAPLGFAEQVQTILAAAGWDGQPADEAVHLMRTAELFGGLPELVTALGDRRASLLGAFWASGRDAATRDDAFDDGPEGPPQGERAPALTLEDLRGRVDDVDALVPDLERRGVLTRGLMLACLHCRAMDLYRLADLGEAFRCARCGTRQPLTPDSWLAGPEPSWHYALAEVVDRFLARDGDLALLGAVDLLAPASADGAAVGRLDCLGRLELRHPDGGTSTLDLVARRGSELWIGAVTTQPCLVSAGKAENRRLERLREVAKVLGARGVVLVTSDVWRDKTVERAHTHFPGSWPRLEVRSSARRVGDPPPAPAA